jgi:hypothetical protein
MNRTRIAVFPVAASLIFFLSIESRAQLSLNVNADTGAVQLVNDPTFSLGPVSFEYYEIQSDTGSLNLGGWQSLTSQGYTGWTQLGASGDNLLGEANLSSFTELALGQSLSLGTAYKGFAGIPDLTFKFGALGGGLLDGPVFYTGGPPPGLPGDYNFDGIVSHADYSVLGDTYGSTGNLAADGNGDGTVGIVDYQLYRAHYGSVAAFSAFGDVPSGLPLVVVPTTTPQGNTQWTITVQGVPNSLAGHLNIVSSQSNFLSAAGGSSLQDDGTPPAGVPGLTPSGVVEEGVFFESRRAFAALGSTLGAPSPGQNREFVTLVTQGDEFTTLSLSGEFGYQGATYFVNESYSFGPGSSPSEPLLPDSTAPGEFIFQNAPSGAWVDPPLVDRFEYVMDSASLFTAILDFPPGFAAEFAVTAENTLLGEFGPGESVNFVQLLGHGVESFIVSNITPLADAADPSAFPIKLEYSTPTASFRMLAVPEPASLVLVLLCCGLFGVRGRRLTRL